jgi:hypothetical protein
MKSYYKSMTPSFTPNKTREEGMDLNMPKEDRSLLYDIMSLQSTSDDETETSGYVKDFLIQYSIPYTVDSSGNIFATKGVADVYPCYVGHLDTVHDYCDNYAVVTSSEKWFAYDMHMMQSVGIGGDDKVGMFMCIKALIELDNVKCAFFSREEIGCVGSGAADMTFFNDVSFVLQADRKGNTDFIKNTNGVDVNSKENREFIQPLLTKYGYTPALGSVTDVGALKKKGLSVMAANVSCGYYEAHTDNEYIVIEDVYACWLFFKEMAEKYGSVKIEHTAPPEPVYSNYGYYGRNYWDWDTSDKNVQGKGKNGKPLFKEYKTCVSCNSIVLGSKYHPQLCEQCVEDYTFGDMRTDEVLALFGLKPVKDKSKDTPLTVATTHKHWGDGTITMKDFVAGDAYLFMSFGLGLERWVKRSDLTFYK